MSTRRIETQQIGARECRNNPPRLSMAALKDQSGKYKILPRAVRYGEWAEFANALAPGDVLEYRRTGYKTPFVATNRADIIADEPQAPAAAPTVAPAASLAGAPELETARSLKEAIADKTKIVGAEMRVELAQAAFLEFKLQLEKQADKINELVLTVSKLEQRIEGLEQEIDDLAGEIEEAASSEDAQTAAALQGAATPQAAIATALAGALPEFLEMGKAFLKNRETELNTRQIEALAKAGFKPAEQPQQENPGINPGY